jgi:outer membrane protein assembly factor BamA/autotransporter translocation and assembly factor TamB
MRRRLVIVCLALLLLMAVAVLVVHTPPIRSLALRYAIRVALNQGVQITAQRLDYNLIMRQVRLANVEVSAPDDLQPFFVADEVAATASYRVFFGDVAFDQVSVRNGAVHVVRRVDGTINLPKSSGTSSREPAPLPIARVSAPRLAVEYRDEPADLTFRAPALTLELSSHGRLSLEAPADFSIGETGTRFTSIDSDAVFDGRDLLLSNLRLVTEELRAQLAGTLALIRRQPSMDLRVSGESELEDAAKWWGQKSDPPRGSVHVEGTVAGALGDPTADFELTSNGIAWQRLDIRNLFGRVRLDDEGLDVNESRGVIGGGQVNAAGGLSWQAREGRVKASWRDIDTAQIIAALSDSAVALSGRTQGELTASGSINSIETWNVDARLQLEDGQPERGRLPAPGEAHFHLIAGQWALDGRHFVGGVTAVDFSVTGQLRGSDVVDSTVTGTLHASESDLQAIFRMLSDTGLASIEQDLVTGAIRATADVEGTLRSPVLQLIVDSDKAVVAGQEIVDVQIRGRLDGRTFELEELVGVQPSGSDGQEGSGRLRVAGQFDLRGQSYTGTANATSWRIAPTSDLPLSGIVDLDYSGEGRGRMVFGKARVLSNLTVSPDIPLGQIVADVDLQGDRATIMARAPEFNAVADANVRLESPFVTMFRANAEALDLARAVRDMQLPISIDGTADVRLDAEGPLSEWRDGRASLELAALNGHVQTLPVSLREPARLQYADGRVRIERLEASLGNTMVSAAGALPLSSSAVNSKRLQPSTPTQAPSGDAVLATLTGDLYDVAVAASVAANATRDPTQPPIAAGQGPLVLLARITGSLEAPNYAGDLEVGPGMVQVRSDLAPVENLLVRAHLENGVLELRDFVGRYHGANVIASGHAPLALLTGATSQPANEDVVLQATAVGVTAAVLAPFVSASTLGQVGGSLDAKLALSSPSLSLDDVEGEVVVERLNLTVADLPVTQRMPTRVVARDGIARVTSWAWESEGTSIEVSGQVHLRDQQAAIQANGKLDARLLTPFLSDTGVSTAGQIDTRLSLTGVLTEPTINGDVRLANGELRLREPRIVAGDLNAVAVLARGNAFLTSLTGTVNGGMLSGSGQVQYTPDLRGQFTANVTRMAMDFPEGLRTEVDSTVELTTAVKDGETANRLSGLVTIRRGAYREPLALLAGVLNNLQRSGTTTGSPPSPFLQSLTLDVRVITDEDLIIDNNVAKAQLGADLRVINVASAPALSGRAELREGGLLYFGRNTYTVQNGAIDFVNPSMIEPILGIEATTRVSGVDIDVRITGTPANLMTELTSPSDPDLGQADLTALLLTGRRLNELGEQQAAVVGAQVLGNLAGDVLGFAGRAVGLDTLRVGAETNPRDPADLASEVDPTSRVTFGKSLGSKVDVTLSQSLVESNAQTWIIDYLPIRRLALRFVQGDEELRSYEFRHDVTFGSAPNAIRSGDVSREIERPPVSSIQFVGDLQFPEPQLRDLLRLEEGDRFDFIDWQADRDRLESFYRSRQHLAARVVTRRSESAGAVALTYEIEAGPQTYVRVSGMSLPRGALDEIDTAWTQSVYDGFLIEEAAAIVRRELAAQAAYQPSLEVRIEGDESVRTLVIDVTPGPRAEQIDVRFDGVDDQLRSQLLQEVGGRTNAVQALTDPRDYERTILTALRARGYAQAAVTVGVPAFEETMATVPVSVTSGPQFRIGMVSFAGMTSIPADDLRGEANVQEGSFYRVEDVATARMRLETRYRREGFTMTSVEAREAVRDASVDVVFTIQEGPRQTIQDITVVGLRSVAQDVVKRAMRLNVGENLRTTDWLEARRRLFESGLFRRVDIAVEPLEGPPETSRVRLRVVVEEWPALRLRYGFQVAEERPEENVNGRDLVPGVSVDLTRRTLFGRAVTIGAAGQYESLERMGRLFVNTPTFLGRPVQSSLTLEQSREESRTDTLVSNRTTAAWEQRGRWGALSVRYGLRFERNRTFDTKPIDLDFPFDLTAHIGRLTSSATWDTRDDPSDATRGTFVSTSLEHGTSRLGSDLLFLRSLTQAYRFTPWKAVVLASAARYGAVKPLGGQVLVPSLRFFVGGARTVRGVDEDSLGGVDFLGNPIGGRGLFTLNQEVRFPVHRWLRGVAFIDMGNVFPEGSGLRLKDLVGSTGLGLRVVTPFALLRVDYGRTIWNRPVDDSGRWIFGIGQTF